MVERDRIGQKLGNYRLEKHIGRGGYADVYLGVNIHVPALEAAVKVLHRELSKKERKNFHTEAQKMAELRHDHIVRLLDFGVEQGVPYLVMDLAPGGTLRKKHPEGVQIPLPTVVFYVKQVAGALQYAHDCKIIHRDVKPANLLLGPNDEVLLSDFGIAQVVHTGYSSSTVSQHMGTGSIPYMPPEQINGKADPKSDQYALGVVVYEWLSGRLPFTGTFVELVAKHLQASPPPLPKQIRIPPEVEEVVLKALAKKPEDRFENVQAFAAALEDASQAPEDRNDSKPVSTSILQPTSVDAQAPVSVGASSQRKGISRRVLLLGGATVVGTAVIVGVTELISKVGGPPPPRQLTATPTSTQSAHATPTAPTPTPASPTAPPFAQSHIYTGHSGEVDTVGWSPDGRRIASGSRDQSVQVWDARTGKTIRKYTGHANWVFAVAWSSDSTRIASGSVDTTVHVWDAVTGVRTTSYQGHSAAVHGVAWLPGGEVIASGGDDHSVRIWTSATGSTFFTYMHKDAVQAVAWSPDGKYLASASVDKTVQVWQWDASTKTARLITTYTGHQAEVDAVTWSPDSLSVASASTTVHVWEATTGKISLNYTEHTAPVDAVAWSPGGKAIASGSQDQSVLVWDAHTGNTSFSYQPMSWVHAVSWAPDSSHVASAQADNTVRVWSL